MKRRESLLASTAILLITLSGCASTASNTSTPSTSPTSAQPPSPSHSPAQSAASTAPSGPDTTPSDLVVDYASFSGWDSKPEGLTPAQSHLTEGSREHTCDLFFETNGATAWMADRPEAGWTGEQIVGYVQPRLELAWQLNLDTTDDQNAAIAKHLLECLASQVDSNDPADAFYMLTNIFDTGRLSSLEIPSPALDMEKITRESTGGWYNGSFNAYVTEYQSVNGIGDTVYPIITFEASQHGDYRLSSINNLTGGDEPVVWGTRPPVILDPSRADAPYDLQ